MAIIYTYPTKTQPTDNDLILISDAEDQNKTKQITVSSLKSSTACVTSIIAGNNITIDPVNGVGDVTINASGSVTSVTSANTAISVANTTLAPVLTSTAYSGGTSIGHVPTGGSNTTFLRGDGTWVTPSSGGSNLAIEDEGNAITGAATSINFKGGGVFAEVPDPNSPGKVDVEVLPRLNHGFSPFPIYQGNDVITVNPGSVTAIACNTICDIAAGQLTIVRVYGTTPVNCNINVAVYNGELGAAASTKLVAFANGVNIQGASNQIIQLDLDDMLPNAAGANPLWSPVAGTPIVVLIEIDNVLGQSDAHILGSTDTSFPNSGITGVFGNSLAWQIIPLNPKSIFQTTGANTNIKYQDSITQVDGYAQNEQTQFRVCHHFDPFAP